KPVHQFSCFSIFFLTGGGKLEKQDGDRIEDCRLENQFMRSEGFEKLMSLWRKNKEGTDVDSVRNAYHSSLTLFTIQQAEVTNNKEEALIKDRYMCKQYCQWRIQVGIIISRTKLSEGNSDKALELRDIGKAEGVKGKHFFLYTDAKGPTLRLDNTLKTILTVRRCKVPFLLAFIIFYYQMNGIYVNMSENTSGSKGFDLYASADDAGQKAIKVKITAEILHLEQSAKEKRYQKKDKDYQRVFQEADVMVVEADVMVVVHQLLQ
ncbi:spindle and kinetochore-associated protein 1, partial [Tanacetum coccineum]